MVAILMEFGLHKEPISQPMTVHHKGSLHIQESILMPLKYVMINC
jgi:hypothetical protein